MTFDKNAFNLIATSLSKHYDSIYFVDLKSFYILKNSKN